MNYDDQVGTSDGEIPQAPEQDNITDVDSEDVQDSQDTPQEGDEQEEADGEAQTPEEPPPVKKASRRDRQMAEQREELKALKKQVGQLTDTIGTKGNGQTPPGQTEPPKMDDFDNMEDYISAVTDHKIEQQQKNGEATKQQETAQADHEKAVEVYNDREDTAREQFRDYDDVVDPEKIIVNAGMHQAILHSKSGPAMTYYLASNPKEMGRLASLPPGQAAFELGMAVGTGKVAQPTPKTKTNAPAPKKPLKGGGAPKSSLADADFNEYKRRRMAGEGG